MPGRGEDPERPPREAGPPPGDEPRDVSPPVDTAEVETRTRWAALSEYEDWSEMPMVVLSFVWLALVVIELAGGGSPLFNVVGTAIWVVFVLDFVLRFLIAPDRVAYLRASALTAVALVLPALRVFRLTRALRILRLGRTTRGLHLVRLLTSFRRGMRTLTATMQRRGLTYVVALTILVVFLGAAGMYAFETGATAFPNYGEALWWTAMLLTTLGSSYAPVSAEARLLTLLLGMYGLAVFGYITAALASFFIADEAAAEESEVMGRQEALALRREIEALRRELRARTAPDAAGADDAAAPDGRE